MTDTDSLFYEIKTDDWYDDIREDVRTLYDTSAYSKDHPAGLERVNKKVIGMMKDEMKGRVINEYGGRCAKTCIFTVVDYSGMCGKSFAMVVVMKIVALVTEEKNVRESKKPSLKKNLPLKITRKVF